jgi:predicted DNA-binding transcriptional regulator AlpA
LRQWEQQGKFPKPLKLGYRSARYPAAQVEEWLKKAQAGGNPAPDAGTSNV